MAYWGLNYSGYYLPIIGFITGAITGYIGFQAIFGSSVVSTTLAIVIAMVVGLLFAIMSYLFFNLAVFVLLIALGAMVFSYLGVYLGLNEDGFVVFLMSITGAILGGIYATGQAMSLRFIIMATSLLGVAYILAGIMLIVGNVSLSELHEVGVTRTLLSVVDQSFLWLIVWIGGSLITAQMQYRLTLMNTFISPFEYAEPINNNKRGE